jgi:hypothetical protein
MSTAHAIKILHFGSHDIGSDGLNFLAVKTYTLLTDKCTAVESDTQSEARYQ